MALYFMSDMEMSLSIFVMPSQLRASGISSWKRMSSTPATHAVLHIKDKKQGKSQHPQTEECTMKKCEEEKRTVLEL
jgi:hypothetical protein